MTRMNISLPEGLRSFVEKQVSTGIYSSTSEYVSELIRKDNDRVRLRELLLAGAESEPTVLGPDYFESLRSRARSARRK
ncbi:MAG: type II toxin-antitoxin system ParD family antitoxin [Pyrinomonadaceae bacterium]